MPLGDDDSYQSDFQEKYNNAYSNSRKNSLKLIQALLDKFGSLSPHNDQASDADNMTPEEKDKLNNQNNGSNQE